MLAVTMHKSMPTGSTDGASQLDLAAEFTQHRTIIESLAKGYMGKALKLFVTMSGLVTAEDALALAPLLWEHCLLGNADASLTASVSASCATACSSRHIRSTGLLYAHAVYGEITDGRAHND